MMNRINLDGMNYADQLRKAAIGHTNAAIIVHQHLQDRNTTREDSTWVSLHNLIGLGSGLIPDHNQKMTVAASRIAEKNVSGHRSYRVATRRQSLRRPNMISMRLRRL